VGIILFFYIHENNMILIVFNIVLSIQQQIIIFVNRCE